MEVVHETQAENIADIGKGENVAPYQPYEEKKKTIEKEVVK